MKSGIEAIAVIVVYLVYAVWIAHTVGLRW